MKFQYFRDMDEFSKIENELKIQINNPIDFAKAIVNSNLDLLVDSMNLLGCENILLFLDDIIGKPKLEIIKYYSTIDIKIWFKLVETYNNLDIALETLNPFNLLYYIKNSNGKHRIHLYKNALKNLEYHSNLNEYYKIIMGHSDDISLDKFEETSGDKLLEFLFYFNEVESTLNKLYNMLEGNANLLEKYVLYIANLSARTNWHCALRYDNYINPDFIKYYSNERTVNKCLDFTVDSFLDIDDGENDYIFASVCINDKHLVIASNGVYSVTKKRKTSCGKIGIAQDKIFTASIVNYCLYDSQIIIFAQNDIFLISVVNDNIIFEKLGTCRNTTKNIDYTGSFADIEFFDQYFEINNTVYKICIVGFSDSPTFIRIKKFGKTNIQKKYVTILQILIKNKCSLRKFEFTIKNLLE